MSRTRAQREWACAFPQTAGRFDGGHAMDDAFREQGPPSRRERHRRRQRRERAAASDLEDDLLTPEERSYRDARRLAERKVRLAGDALKVGVIGLLLLHFVWPLGVIFLIFCGAGLFRKVYRVFFEPALRERFIQREVRNQVQATLSHERRQLEDEHARSLEQLSASIAHEIRNPITAAKSLVQQMEEEPTAPDNVEYARVALEELDRVERSVSHLLRFARDEEMSISRVRLAEVVDSALETFRDRVARTGVELRRQVDCDGALEGDPEKLRRVVINLVGNALDAVSDGGTPEPRIEVELGENLAGTEVWLRIADNGPGIEPESVEKMFSPFYTSKAGGTGLGLAICRKLVEAHDGRIEVHSRPGHGAEFLVTFPKERRKEGRRP